MFGLGFVLGFGLLGRGRGLQVALAALTLNRTTFYERQNIDDVYPHIVGETAGSTITMSPATLALDITSITLTETLNGESRQTTLSITVSAYSPAITARANIGGSDKPTGWNALASSAAGASTFLLDTSGAATGWTLSVSDAYVGSSSPGHQTSDNSGIAPDVVLSTYAYADGSNAGVHRLSGLDDTKLYDIQLVPSRGGVVDDRDTLFTVGGVSQTIQAASNTSLSATFTGVAPSAGIIDVRVAPGAGSSFGYLNALIVTQQGSASEPVMQNEPTVSGSPEAGSTLTVTAGTWS